MRVRVVSKGRGLGDLGGGGKKGARVGAVGAMKASGTDSRCEWAGLVWLRSIDVAWGELTFLGMGSPSSPPSAIPSIYCNLAF